MHVLIELAAMFVWECEIQSFCAAAKDSGCAIVICISALHLPLHIESFWVISQQRFEEL